MNDLEERISKLEIDIKNILKLYNDGTSYQSIEDDNTISIGYDASHQSIRQGGAIAIGGNSAYQVSQGMDAIALGSHSAYKAVQGNNAIAIGTDACNNGVQGSSTLALGSYACKSASQGNNAIAIGSYSGYCSKQGQYSIAIGYGAGAGYQKANSIILNANGKSQTDLEEYDDDFIVYKDGMSTPLHDGNQNVGGFYVKPIRHSDSIVDDDYKHEGYNTDVAQLYYNKNTGEIYTSYTVPLNLRCAKKTDNIKKIGYDASSGDLVWYEEDINSESEYSDSDTTEYATSSDSDDNFEDVDIIMKDNL